MILHFEESGSGTPLILLHGFLSSGHYWSGITSNLDKHYRVITIDLLGFGKSPKPKWSDYSLETHAEAVAATIYKILGATPFVIVGHSMGALIAGEVANRLPIGRIRKLVLMNMPVFRTSVEARATFSETGRLYRTLLYSPLGRALWPIINISAKIPIVRIAARSYKTAVASSSHNIHASRTRSFRNTIETTNSIEVLNALNVPTLLVHGEYDRPIYLRNILNFVFSEHIELKCVNTGHHTPLLNPLFLRDVLVDSKPLF